MDLSSEMSKHGRNPISHKLEDQKKVRVGFFNYASIYLTWFQTLMACNEMRIKVLLRRKQHVVQWTVMGCNFFISSNFLSNTAWLPGSSVSEAPRICLANCLAKPLLAINTEFWCQWVADLTGIRDWGNLFFLWWMYGNLSCCFLSVDLQHLVICWFAVIQVLAFSTWGSLSIHNLENLLLQQTVPKGSSSQHMSFTYPYYSLEAFLMLI